MKLTAQHIAEQAVAAAFDMLKANGLESEAKRLPELLKKAADARSESLVATITTPNGDAGPLKDVIRDVLEKKTGKKIEIAEKADPSLVGGVLIQYGDERIDMSVLRSLERARTELSSTSSL